MEMQKSFIVIDMTNSSDDFCENWVRIQKLKENDREYLNKLNNDNFYLYDSSSISGGYGAVIADINKKCKILKKLDVERMPQQYGICLRIKDCAENDTIEYQYLALMLQNIQDLIAYIYPEHEERIYEVSRKVSCFFSFFIQKLDRRERIWIQKKVNGELFSAPLAMELSINSYKVTPILEFDELEANSTFQSLTWGLI